MRPEEQWDDPVEAQQRTHHSHPSDWRSLSLKDNSLLAEYTGPQSGSYVPTPWSEQKSFDREEDDPVAGVYLIQGRQSGLVKVGWSKNVYARLGTMQTGSSEELVLVDVLQVGRTVEPLIHEQNADIRVRGEWFKPEILGRLLGI